MTNEITESLCYSLINIRQNLDFENFEILLYWHCMEKGLKNDFRIINNIPYSNESVKILNNLRVRNLITIINSDFSNKIQLSDVSKLQNVNINDFEKLKDEIFYKQVIEHIKSTLNSNEK